MKKTGLTTAEAETLAELLTKAKFPLPKEVFDAWTETLPTGAFELCITRKTSDGLEVFMLQRPGDDKHWPFEWHIPGTVLRDKDTYPKLFGRLMKSEIGGGNFGKLRPVGTRIFPKGEGLYRCRRGHETALLYTVEFLKGTTPDNGCWFPIDQLPKNTVSFHHTLVAMVRKHLGV
ncbi:MAG: hypothetical protein V4467_01530 [Patescibacteria group bacterium]